MAEGENNPNEKILQDWLDQYQQKCDDAQKQMQNQGARYYPYGGHHYCRPRRYCPYCGQLLDSWDWNGPYYTSSTSYLGGGHNH